MKSRRVFYIIFSIAIIVLAVLVVIKVTTAPVEESPTETTAEEVIEEEIAPVAPATPPVINLQPVVDAWLGTLSANTTAGVIIYDLDNDVIVAEHNPDTIFSMESLYKLYPVYAGYKAIAAGAIDPNARINGNRTWATCLDLAIRESDSPCGEAMRAYFGIDALSTGTANLRSLTAAPRDILNILQLYLAHPDFDDVAWAKIQDSMLNQPPTYNGMCGSSACNWRQGLPTGFKVATVYDKVGWRSSGKNHVWTSYHDAAFVDFPDLDRHYIVVAMTKNSFVRDLVNLGTKIEEYVLNYQ